MTNKRVSGVNRIVNGVWSQRAAHFLLGVLGFAVLIVLWKTALLLNLVDGRYLPSPFQVAHAFIEMLQSSPFWSALAKTMTAWGLGFSISVGMGIIVGVVIGSSGFLKRVTHSTIEFLRPVPSVALISLAVLLYGTRVEAELLIIVYACTWPVIIQVLHGLADIDRVASDTAKSLGLGGLARIRYLAWPTALPYLMTGIRIAATVALILAITAELIIGTPGLGGEVAKAQANGAIPRMYALIFATGAVGVIVNLGSRLAERKLLFWHPSIRREKKI